MAEMWKRLAPHHNIFLADEPMKLSGNIDLPKPDVTTISHWLMSGDEDPDPIKLDRFMRLPEAA